MSGENTGGRGQAEERELDVSLWVQIVNTCVLENDLSRLRSCMRKLKKSQRQKIVNTKSLGNTPLFNCCLTGKLHFINFFLDECAADIESKGTYEVAEDRSKHAVTPLWCAAVANKLDVVKTLVAHGADVNSPSDTGSTPVRSACYMTNVDVIKYLVGEGADIHTPNCNGGTCLINAVQNADLCKFLLDQGAKVNACDNSGNLALHYAIREGMVDTVKLLLRHGSDYRLRNEWGDDALQTAALRGAQNIVEIILDMTEQTPADAVRAYELLGTNFIDEKNDMIAALTVWKKAMSLRYLYSRQPMLKALPERKSVYKNIQEPQTLEQLNSIYDPEEIQILALLTRERILGPNHKDTTFGLMYRGAVYADSYNFQRCVDLWKYAYTLRYQDDDPLNQECLFTVQALVKLFWEIQVDVDSGLTDEIVQQKDVIDVFQILSDQVIKAKVVVDSSVETDIEAVRGEKVADLQLLMQLYLHMIHLFSKSERSQHSKVKFMKLIHKVIMVNPRGEHGETFLHLAVDPKISQTSEEFYSSFPALTVIKILVSCGADLKFQCDKGNTPLLKAAKSLAVFDAFIEESVVTFLLEAGSHIDTVNKEGETPLTYMERQVIGARFYPMNYLSLKCLASRTIVKHGLKYQDEIPKSLVDFVEMHGPCADKK